MNVFTVLTLVSKLNENITLYTFRKMKTYYRYTFSFLAGSFAVTFILYGYVSTDTESRTRSAIKDQGNKS